MELPYLAIGGIVMSLINTNHLEEHEGSFNVAYPSYTAVQNLFSIQKPTSADLDKAKSKIEVKNMMQSFSKNDNNTEDIMWSLYKYAIAIEEIIKSLKDLNETQIVDQTVILNSTLGGIFPSVPLLRLSEDKGDALIQQIMDVMVKIDRCKVLLDGLCRLSNHSSCNISMEFVSSFFNISCGPTTDIPGT